MRTDPEPVAAPARSAPPPIDGVAPDTVVAPATPAEVAEILLDAAERGLAVAPVGGGTALALGNPPQRIDLALATANLGGIIDYTPTDLVLSVGAGARLGDVQAVLAEHGQTLPIDPPGGAEATIGGLIATALTGPRRLGSGTLRDLLIGIAVAHPSGTVTRAGGMVVKNVSGFDLPRLYHGSLGTLGVIVSANFKVLPLARFEATALARHADLAAALAAAARVRAGRVHPVALEAALLDGEALAAIRLEGREPAVRALLHDVRTALGDRADLLTGTESAGWWHDYVARQRLTVGPDEALVRLTARPRQTAALAEGVAAALSRLGAVPALLAASVGLGTVVVRLRLPNGSAERLAAAQATLLGLAEHVTILAAPAAWKRGLDVWGPEPAGFAVMRALKEQFDPNRVLNPGRFAGFI